MMIPGRKKAATGDGRLLLPDILKGFAILLVIVGHCIQETNGMAYSSATLFFQNKVYQFIYSFHMPLFMLICGYFSYVGVSKAKTVKGKVLCIWRKVYTCLIPVYFWTAMEIARACYYNSKQDGWQFRLGPVFKAYLKLCPKNFWFLWAVLICFLVTFIIHFVFKDSFIVYGILYIVMFFLPDSNNMNVYEFMLPFFVAGFLYKKYEEGDLVKKCKYFYFKHRLAVLLGAALVFALLFLVYNDKILIYVSGYNIHNANPVKMVGADVYRMVIGFVGSLFFILLFDCIKNRFGNFHFPVLTAMGKVSMGMYIIQTYIILLVIKPYTLDNTYSLARSVELGLVASAGSLILAYLLSIIPVIKYSVGKR